MIKKSSQSMHDRPSDTLGYDILVKKAVTGRRMLQINLAMMSILIICIAKPTPAEEIPDAPRETSLSQYRPAAGNAIDFVVLGDSISAAANTTSIGVHYGHSFASAGLKDGPAVNGLHARLERAYPFFRIDNHNFAVPGGSSFYLPGQAQLAARLKPRFASMLIGANDACRWPKDNDIAVDRFRARVHSALEKMVAANSQVRILLLPIPDMTYLLAASEGKDCVEKRNRLRICWDLINPSHDEIALAQFKQRIDLLNAVLADAADQFRDNVWYREELKDLPFAKEHVSDVDCFHPSVKGQAHIADLSWDPAWAGAE